MRNPTFILASVAAAFGVASIVVAIVGDRTYITPYIIGISLFMTLGATFTATRAARQSRV
jgi:ABC-type enterochelin transport system permease subunit